MRFPVSPRLTVAVLAAILLLSAGCAKTSPFVGTWTGSQGPVTATMEMKEDGTGSVTLMNQQRPMNWKSEDDKTAMITITPPQGGGANAPTLNLTGTMGEDKKSMNVNMGGPMNLTFTKQGDAK